MAFQRTDIEIDYREFQKTGVEI